MAGYYDYEALFQLEKPLLLTGYVHGDTRAVAHRLAALSGLPFSDLDRKVEHHAGSSIPELIWSEGVERYRSFEREQLVRELRDRPFGVVALGDGTLLDPRSLRLARDEAVIVLLDLDLANCYWRLQARGQAQQSPWHPTAAGPLESLEDLRPFYNVRRTGFAHAHHGLDMRGEHPSGAAEALLAWLREQG